MSSLRSHHETDPLEPLRAPVLLALVLAVNITALLLPPGKTRIFLFLPPLLLLAAQGPSLSTGTRFNDYSLGCNLVTLTLTFVDRVILSHAEQDFYSISDGATRDDAGKPKPHDFGGWRDKLWWSSTLAIGQRGIGWSYQVKGLRRGVSRSYPRWKFAASQLACFVGLYPLLEVLQSVFQTSNANQARRPGALLEEPLWYQLLMSLAFAFWVFGGLTMAWSLGAAFTTITGLSRPSDWPPLYGPISHTSTLRGFWG